MEVTIPMGLGPGMQLSVQVPAVAPAVVVPVAATTESPGGCAVPVAFAVTSTASPVQGMPVQPAIAVPAVTAAMELASGDGSDPLSGEAKKLARQVKCDAVATLFFSVIMFGSVGGILGVAAAAGSLCCAHTLLRVARFAREARPMMRGSARVAPAQRR